MVCYCCVKVCKNNTNNVRKSSHNISFHAFPSNPDLRLKWVRAIGRPNWDPPNYTRICSVHFSDDKVNKDGYRTRIKDDAYPVKALPPNANFEASYLEVCRICLATDTKLYSLETEALKMCMNTITGSNEKYNMEGLPQYVCYECKANILKCNRLIEKSVIAQATLLDIFSEHGEITKLLIKKKDRERLNLTSSLTCWYGTPTFTSDQCPYHVEYSGSHPIPINNVETDMNGITVLSCNIKDEQECLISNNNERDMIEVKYPNSGRKSKQRGHINFTAVYIGDNNEETTIDNSNDKQNEENIISSLIDVTYGKSTSSTFDYRRNNRNTDILKNYEVDKSYEEVTSDEVNLQQYFNIVKLSDDQQLQEWNNTVAILNKRSKFVYKCAECSKPYASEESLKTHLSSHVAVDGASQCRICKCWFKGKSDVDNHINRVHTRKFYCKLCPKSYGNISTAKKHLRSHEGRERKQIEHVVGKAAHFCVRCGRGFRTSAALSLHLSTAHRHAQIKEEKIDETHRCEECDVNFLSEGARRFHLLASSHHLDKKDTARNIPDLETSCKWCGLRFPSAGDVTSHARAQHRRPRARTAWALPGDKYPTTCEHCDEQVKNRQEHWRHVQRAHPSQRRNYRAVVNAVCAQCGKGFQNPSKLRMHELRHGRAQFPCEECGRSFHDLLALRRHGVVHLPNTKPLACSLCPRTFLRRASLIRHAKVHSNEQPYSCDLCGKKFKHSGSVRLHVRTVHLQLKTQTTRRLRPPAAKDTAGPVHLQAIPTHRPVT